MNYTDEAWEEEQMCNLGCESVADLIRLAKNLLKNGKPPEPPELWEIQIWFHAQEGGFLAEPHVVITYPDQHSAYEAFDSINMYDPFHIQLVKYDDNGDGDIHGEGGTWECEEE
jgi:hypothetical protein